MEKRYSIVRVDDRCPVEVEENIYLIDRIKMFPCFNDKRLSCKKCNYGDTKEQMILKVAQILFKNAPKETYLPRYLEQKRKILEVSKKIVEFLGVEDDTN